MTDRRLAAWKPRDLATHLEELATAAVAWKANQGDRIAVTLHLASGQRHTGFVLDFARGTVTLQSLPQRGTADLDVTVIPRDRIEALTLHAAQTMVAIEPTVDAATTPLELKRRAKVLADQLATRVGKPIAVEIGAGELAQLATLFELLRLALDKVCADELGRGALAERVQRIEVRGGDPSLSIANGVLVVAGALGAEQLRTRLDAAL